MLTDSQLHQDVLDALQWEPGVREDDVDIAVKDGVVTVSGFVDSYPEKYLVERTVEKTTGVRAIADDLRVKLPATAHRADTEVAHAVANALGWSVQVPVGAVTARVEDGWVTLHGEVDRYYQVRAAERAVRDLTGVRGVTNLVAIRPAHASTLEVSQKIKDALRRSAELDASRITVESAGGTITLKGTVRSYVERREAEYAAWSAPGVTAVDDHIVVSP